MYRRGKQALPRHAVVTNTRPMTTMFLSNAKCWSLALAPRLLTYSSFSRSPSAPVVLSVSPHMHLSSPTFWPAHTFPSSHTSSAAPPHSAEMTAHAPAAPTVWHKLPAAQLRCCHGCPVTLGGGAVWRESWSGGWRRGCRRPWLHGTAEDWPESEPGCCPPAFGHVTCCNPHGGTRA